MIKSFIQTLGPLSLPFFTATIVSALALALAPILWKRHEQRDEPTPAYLRFLPYIALVITLLATLIAWRRQSSAGQEQAFQKLDQEVARYQAALQTRMRSYEDLLRLAAEQVGSDGRLEPEAWERYVASLRLKEKYPTVLGFGYAAHVRQDQVRKFIPTLRTHTGSAANLMPPGERFDYFIVKVIEPQTGNVGTIGFDLGSDLAGRSAAELSRDNALPALTGKMNLPGDAQGPGFLYLWPLYQAGKPTSTIDFRQAAIKGWIFARFRQEDLLSNVGGSNDSIVRMQVFDGPAMTPESLFYDTAASVRDYRPSPDSPHLKPRSFAVGGRHWTIRYTPKPAFETLLGSGRPSAVFFGGLLFSAWTFGFVWLMGMIRTRAERMARDLTNELQDRQIALAAGPQAIMITDATQPENPIVFVNSRFEKVTGYASSEALGRNPRFLQGRDGEQKGLKEIRKGLKEQREVRALLRNYKKDGTPFWNDLTLTPIRNQMGRVLQWSGVMNDVTDREQSERRLSTQVAVIRALSESTQLTDAASRVLQALCEGQDWEFGALWILDTRAQALRCVETWQSQEIEGHELDMFVRQASMPRDTGLPGLVWSRHEPVWLDDTSQESNLPEASIASRLGLSSACGFPIASRKGLLGVMTFYSRKIWPLNKNLLLLMVGTGTQISQFIERQQTKDQEQELTTLEHGLAEFMGDGLLAMDRDGFCIYANAAAGRMLGYAPRAVLGENLHTLLHPEGFVNGGCTGKCPVLLSLQSTQPCYVDDNQIFWRQDKNQLPVSYTTSPIIDSGLIQGVVITFLDVTERRLREEEVRRVLEQREQEIVALREKVEALPMAQEAQVEALEAPPLEIVQPEGAEEDHDHSSVNAESAHGTVLLVEEDRVLRTRTAQFLRHKGYQVLPASNAGEALLISERGGGSIDILIADLMGSHLSGKLLFQRLEGLCPRLKVLYSSVYSVKAVIDQGLLEPGMPFIRKPFNPDVLLQKIQQVLE